MALTRPAPPPPRRSAPLARSPPPDLRRTPAAGNPPPGLAVDNTASPSTTAGRLYLASPTTDLLYGFDSTGATLGSPFPLDPATAPGAPAGSPKYLCGAAVDCSGNVWVSNAATKNILKYDSDRHLPRRRRHLRPGRPLPARPRLRRQPLRRPSPASPPPAAGPSTATPPPAATPPPPRSTSPRQRRRLTGLAVDPSTDDLYVCQQGGNSGSTSTTPPATSSTSSPSASPATLHRPCRRPRQRRRLPRRPRQRQGPRLWRRPPPPRGQDSGRRRPRQHHRHPQRHRRHPGRQPHQLPLRLRKRSRLPRRPASSDLSSGGTVPCDQDPGSIPLDLDAHPVTAPVTDLTENTQYRFRLSATNANGPPPPIAGSFTTAGPPLVETAGSPLRTATTAPLDARVDPSRAAATYHFEYGSQGLLRRKPLRPRAPACRRALRRRSTPRLGQAHRP